MTLSGPAVYGFLPPSILDGPSQDSLVVAPACTQSFKQHPYTPVSMYTQWQLPDRPAPAVLPALARCPGWHPDAYHCDYLHVNWLGVARDLGGALTRDVVDFMGTPLAIIFEDPIDTDQHFHRDAWFLNGLREISNKPPHCS